MLKENYAIKLLGIVLIFSLIIPPIIRAWNWREDEFKLFDLCTEMKTNQTDFYTWLGVKPSASLNEITKAHRQLVLKLHPETSIDKDAAFKFEITNQVAFYLRSPRLRSVYDSILEKQGQVPYWKGFHYMYTRHKLACMSILVLLAMSLMEYLKAWEKYLSEKLVMDQFVTNARVMAQRMSDKHSSAKTHKSYIDFGDETIQCEITSEKEIFIVIKGERVPLASAHLVQKPSFINNMTLLRIPIAYIKQTAFL